MCTKRIRKEVELEDIHGKEKKTKTVNFRPSIENMRWLFVFYDSSILVGVDSDNEIDKYSDSISNCVIALQSFTICVHLLCSPSIPVSEVDHTQHYHRTPLPQPKSAPLSIPLKISNYSSWRERILPAKRKKFPRNSSPIKSSPTTSSSKPQRFLNGNSLFPSPTSKLLQNWPTKTSPPSLQFLCLPENSQALKFKSAPFSHFSSYVQSIIFSSTEIL